MKQILLSVLFLFFSCSNDENDLSEPKVFTGDVHLLNQNQIDNFGSNNYTKITGTLRINPVLHITTLPPLSTLEEVGSLRLEYIQQGLSSLEGLNNLMMINNDLVIQSCWSISDISALNNLESIGNNLFIVGNHSLNSIDYFNDITELNGSLSINFNESLTSLVGLNNLNTIGGFLTIRSNYLLENMNGLNSLQRKRW